ncbi:tektin [Holotrichia oblita]|uniref:Tektin n=1 Tax=Holotrichia oblita TaxID=644536 RepID=A0ACB9TF72_HOLOL|nr:tektin [Holotrichia oblita]
MTEYPARTCGVCPHLAKYNNVAEQKGDYLQLNTVPRPDLLLQKRVTLNDHVLTVPSANEHPDLKVPAFKAPDDDCPCAPITEEKPPDTPCEKGRYHLKDVIHPKANELPPICVQRLEEASRKYTEANVEPISAPVSQSVPVSTPPVEAKPLKGILKNKMDGQIAPCPCEERMEMPPECPPSNTDPHIKPGTDMRPEPNEGKPPCYMPQPEDTMNFKVEQDGSNLGAWATGRVDWGPLAGLTGTRPVVDKYTITRFSEGEWRLRNKEILELSGTELHKASLIEYNGRQCLEQTRADTDKNQEDSTRRLKLREQEVFRWKCELERAIDAAREEIELIEKERRRLKHAMAVLMLPESIAGECLERRATRLDPELVRDEVEEELIKETALIAEIKILFEKTLKDIEMQLLEDKTAKQRLEYDWSDKSQAHEIDVINVALNNRSNVMSFKPGAVRFPDNQSSPEHWENFTRETLQESEATRQRSVALRGTLDAILTNASRDLRTQADRVEAAISKRIACTDEIRIRLENELKKVLQRLADVEELLKSLRNAIRRMDIPMKKAQTRLDNRNDRPRVENCRDVPQFGLVEEVKYISENVTALMSQLTQAEDSQGRLIQTRADLEREIMVKRRTLEVDRDRIQIIRMHYPSATALSGY